MVNHEQLSIKQISKLAGVSVRTLHYYDQIGLLKPQRHPHNQYRYYTRDSLFTLQQILFYRELDFSLEQIDQLMKRPDFDLVTALEQHKKALQTRAKRLETLLETIDNTINNLKGQKTMTTTEYFNGFSDEQQEIYEKEAASIWDPKIVHESNRRWKNMDITARNQLMEKGERITLALRDAMPGGINSPEAQRLVGVWQQHIGFFYECTDEILLGLGNMYVEDERFKAFYDRVQPGLAEFIRDAIKVYCSARGVN